VYFPSGILTAPGNFIKIIASAEIKSFSKFTAACSIFPFGFSQQPVSVSFEITFRRIG
jgi:hypothetical protein